MQNAVFWSRVVALTTALYKNRTIGRRNTATRIHYCYTSLEDFSHVATNYEAPVVPPRRQKCVLVASVLQMQNQKGTCVSERD